MPLAGAFSLLLEALAFAELLVTGALLSKAFFAEPLVAEAFFAKSFFAEALIPNSLARTGFCFRPGFGGREGILEGCDGGGLSFHGR